MRQRRRGRSCNWRGGGGGAAAGEEAGADLRRKPPPEETGERPLAWRLGFARLVRFSLSLSLSPPCNCSRVGQYFPRLCSRVGQFFPLESLFPLPDKPERLIWAKACKGGLRRTIQTPYKLRRVRRLAIWGRPDAKASPKRRLRDALKTMVGINRRIR